MKKLIVIWFIVLSIFLATPTATIARGNGDSRLGNEERERMERVNEQLREHFEPYLETASPAQRALITRLIESAIDLNRKNFELGFRDPFYIRPRCQAGREINLNTFQQHGVIAYGDPEAPRRAYDGSIDLTQPWTFGFTADRN